MLVNHVTEETNPRKFAAQHIRKQIRIIQDPYYLKIAAARERMHNAINYWEFEDACIDYFDLIKEAAGEELGPYDYLSD